MVLRSRSLRSRQFHRNRHTPLVADSCEHGKTNDATNQGAIRAGDRRGTTRVDWVGRPDARCTTSRRSINPRRLLQPPLKPL